MARQAGRHSPEVREPSGGEDTAALFSWVPLWKQNKQPSSENAFAPHLTKLVKLFLSLFQGSASAGVKRAPLKGTRNTNGIGFTE